MKCKQGDLAVIVRSRNGNEGKVVRCIRLLESQTHDADGSRLLYGHTDGPRWVIDPPVKTTFRKNDGTFVRYGLAYSAPDKHLRPLRDGEGADETLTWAGKPRELASA